MLYGSLTSFLAITFGLTWGIAALFLALPEPLSALFGEMGMSNPLFLCAVYSPALAAFVLVARHGGSQGLRRFLSRLFLWRSHAGWYAFILIGIPVLTLVGVALKGTLGEVEFPFSPAYHVFPAIALALAVGPVEEFGWRGVALPLLQQRYAPFWAGLILGAIWAIWHLPAFIIGGTPQSGWSVLPYVFGIVAVSVIMTALFNSTRGSILLAALVHFQLNNPALPDAQPYDVVCYVAAAVLVVFVYRREMFRRADAITDVIPANPP